MTSQHARMGPLVAPADITLQLQITRNSSFPFSSPGLDQQSLSSHSSRSPFESPEIEDSIRSYESRRTDREDGFHLGGYNQDTRPRKVSRVRKNGVPALQLMTNFTKPLYPVNDLVMDQVAVKQAKKNMNHARSVRSQRGVKVNTSPPRAKKNSLAKLRSHTKASETKRQAMIQSPDSSTNSSDQYENSPRRKSVIIGFYTSEPEAVMRAGGNALEQHVSAPTPTATAKAGESTSDLPPSGRRPVSSMYSTMTSIQDVPQTYVPPMPAIPAQHIAVSKALKSRNPFRKLTEIKTYADKDETIRHSQHSDEHMLIRSADDTRPKSQGWWNILTSPLLSRASSLASRKGGEPQNVPPVPRIPSHIEKQTPVSALPSALSPETPRRQGLASVATSTWSNWTEWEKDTQHTQGVTSASAHGPGFEIPIIMDDFQAAEGSAAEYYHACAIEQLAGITYFECVNHSCAEHLPKLRSIFDSSNHRIGALGSPFNHSTRNIKEISTHARKSSQTEPVTPIDSEDEEMSEPPTSKRRKHVKDRIASFSIEGDFEPDELSPNIRKANTAAVVRAKMMGSSERTTPLPVYSRSDDISAIRNIAAVVPKHSDVLSPKPMSPATGAILAPQGAVPMTQLPSRVQATPYESRLREPSYQSRAQEPPYLFVNTQTSYPALPARGATAPITISDLRPMHQVRSSIEDQRLRHEKEDARARKAGGLWRGRGCISANGCAGRSGPEGRKRRRWCVVITVLLILVIAACIVLALTLTRRGTNTPVQSQWLNLTGFPPMPTGISTIAQPALTASENRCVDTTTMWSCTLPKEDQAEVAPNDPDQPNFRFQITFQNGTLPANLTMPLTKRATGSSASSLFIPNPAPPSQADQTFLGMTTDNVTKPFDGEQTPFFITFMSVFPVLPTAFNKSQSVRRDLQDNIPAPDLASDGTAAPASLLPTTPYPVSQPIKLYNRGLQDEHYGFYLYYDKSIFLSAVAIANTTTNKTISDPNADQNGGSTKQQANVRCTFSQTRFVVKMFTNAQFGASLLIGAPNNTITSKQTTNSSATNFNRPGSFPYPTTVLLDRHGGAINTKLTYCYGMDGGIINPSQKQLVFENRSFGGSLVNAAPGLINTGTNDGFNSSLGGIDGGSGGCGCTWQNWS